MLPSASIEARTAAFYAWELRGRGWATYPYSVPLEPPFRPFSSPAVEQSTGEDDARRHTWLSALGERLRGKPAAVESLAAIEEPDPEQALRAGDDDLREVVIAVPKDARIVRGALLGWLRSLSVAREQIAFEVLGTHDRVETRLALSHEDATHVLGQLRAGLPSIAVLDDQGTLAERWSAPAGSALAVVEFGLACEFMVPLAARDGREEPLLPIIAALAALEEGEIGLYQVLLEEARQPWGRSVLRSVVTQGGDPFFADAPEITTLAKEKVASPLFAVALRIAGAAPDADRAWDIVRRLSGGLAQFGSPRTNELIPLPTNNTEVLEEDLLYRTTHRSGMLLSAEELVSLIQFPGAGVQVPQLVRTRQKSKEAPREVRGEGCLLGRNEHGGLSTEVRLSTDAKTKHIHVVGGSGTGKSTLLVRMILEDIKAGHGVGILDPHGDLVDEVVARIPEDRLADVVLFDPSDEEAAIGWNILRAETESEKDLLSSDLVSVFKRLSTSWGDQMTAVLGNAILVFLESDRGGTLLDLRRFLLEDKFRKEMLDTVADPYVRSFWESEFPLLVGKRPQAPILTRLDTFLRSKLVRKVVTAETPTLDFRQITDRGRIFLGKLAQGAIGEENAALLGSLLVSKFHQVTLAREAQAASARRPFFLYIDEFHHVATASMASLFSGARKYRLGLTVAHQDLYQLHAAMPEVERALLGNAYTRICFRVGEEDARQLAKGMSFFEPEDLMGLRVGEAVCRVGGRDGDFNLQIDALDALDPDESARKQAHIRTLSPGRWKAASAGRRPESSQPRSEPAHEPAAPSIGTSTSTPIADAAVSIQTPAEPKPEAKHVDKATLDYLALTARSPFLSVRERNRELALSAWRGQRIKSAILGQGFACEVAINPGGRGERFKLLELTGAGRALLASYGIAAPSGHGRGGIAHQWWVQLLAAWLSEHGIEAAIEDASLGARVDLAFALGEKRVAVEIELSEGHAVENIRKDLAAGFAGVVCLFDDPGALERFRAKHEVLPAGVVVGDLASYETLLTPLLPTLPPLRRPNQDQEPRRQRVRRATTPAALERLRLVDPGALSTLDAADYLGLSPATLETLRCRGGGPSFVKLGRRVVYRREDLDSWLSESRRRSTSDTS